MSKLQLKKKILIQGEIEALTGLLIGGSNTAMGIGGPDKFVIRNPITNEPYIPGSSLKGKMRALLELSFGYIMDVNMGTVKHGPSDQKEHVTALLYGNTNRNKVDQRPARLICRDGKLLNGDSFRDKTDLPYTETKTEVVIDRITAAANPRTLERVPAGAIFKLNLVLNIFDNDLHSEKDLCQATFNALRLLQDDYLGGSGSRGSGQVDIRIQAIWERSAEFYQSGTPGPGIDVLSSINVPEELCA